jgi:hypothetical protein
MCYKPVSYIMTKITRLYLRSYTTNMKMGQVLTLTKLKFTNKIQINIKLLGH